VLKAAAVGGALVVGFSLESAGPAAAAVPPDEHPGLWLRIAADDTVTILLAHSEMGQGVYTALPMLVAEELECDWWTVQVEMAPANPVYRNRMFGTQTTGGSSSVRASFDLLRRIGAAAREMMRMAAAETWQVPLDECRAEGSTVRHPPTGNRLSYGALAATAATLEPPADVPLKSSEAWRLIGRPTPGLDARAKTEGSAVFGADVHLDGMLVGVVRHAPAFGDRLQGVDPAPALALAGVHAVVPLDDAVIVVADGYWPARKGLRALAPAWIAGPNAALSSDGLRTLYAEALDRPGAEVVATGDVDAAISRARTTVDVTYAVPHLAHATMEPMTATAHLTAGGVRIWAPTQNQSAIQRDVAHLLGISPEQVHVTTTFLGGGFGRRLETDVVLQAVRAAAAVRRPVKVMWSREDDLRRDFYRPAAMARLIGGLGGRGELIAWDARLAAASILSRVSPENVADGIDRTAVDGMDNPPYAVANRRVRYVLPDDPIPVGFWRSVGHSYNAYFVESFMDELAHAAGVDPLTFRRRLLAGRPRHRAVLDRAAAEAGWGRRLPEGYGLGLALHESFGSIVAQAVEVSVADGKALRLHRVTCVVDCGVAVNPDGIEAQMESGVCFGLSAALFGAVSVAGGSVVENNFDRYRVLLLPDMPPVDVHIIEGSGAIGGIGEPGVPPAAPALANAVFAATGEHIRALPLVQQGFTLG
jgi:isoquinoline 1-oxidoreductase beta subunit